MIDPGALSIPTSVINPSQRSSFKTLSKTTQLEEAFTGHFTDHHALLLSKMLARIDALDADIAELDAAIEEMIAPFASAVERLDEIPGVGTTTARVIIAEVGLDMSRFPTAAHLASWARFAPGVKESADRKKGKGTTGHGNRYLARALGEAAVPPARPTPSSANATGASPNAAAKRRAIVALGRSILVIVWHLLSDPQARFVDLGPDFYDNRTSPERKKRHHIHQLEALGYKVTLEPTA